MPQYKKLNDTDQYFSPIWHPAAGQHLSSLLLSFLPSITHRGIQYQHWRCWSLLLWAIATDTLYQTTNKKTICTASNYNSTTSRAIDATMPQSYVVKIALSYQPVQKSLISFPFWLGVPAWYDFVGMIDLFASSILRKSQTLLDVHFTCTNDISLPSRSTCSAFPPAPLIFLE